MFICFNIILFLFFIRGRLCEIRTFLSKSFNPFNGLLTILLILIPSHLSSIFPLPSMKKSNRGGGEFTFIIYLFIF